MNGYFRSKILMVFIIGFLTPLGLISSSPALEDWCADQSEIRELLDKSLNEGRDSLSFKKVVQCGEKSVSALSKIVEQSQQRIEANKKEIETLQGNVLIPQSAIGALKKIGPKADEAVDPLIKALEYPIKKEIRSAAGDALREIVPASIPKLLKVLPKQANKGKQIRWRTAEILGKILLDEKDLDRDLVEEIIDGLVAILKTEREDEDVRWAVAGALGRAAQGGKITTSRGQDIVPLLINMLKEPDLHSGARGAAAQALGRIGLEAETVVPILIKEVKDFCPEATEALILYAEVIAKNSNNLKQIRTGGETISKIKRTLNKTSCIKVEELRSVELAEKALRNSFISLIIKYIDDNFIDDNFWLLLIFLIIFVVYLPGNLAILWLRPLWLLKINEALKDRELTIPQFALKISLSWLVLFKYHPRVLNAWVASHLNTVRLKFEGKETVSERDIHVSVPVCLCFSQIDGNFQNVNDLTIEHLKRIFSERKVCLLIWGAGGSGKTSLACQIARWLMKREAISSPDGHLMLPVLIEQELAQAKDSNPLLEAIGGQLQYLIDEPKPISEELLEHLLRRQRILVLVDHLSEMGSDTREIIAPHLPDFPINALIVTSRIEEHLGGVVDAEIKIPRINGKYLANFIYDYLEQRKRLDLFKHKELFDACSQLSIIALSREEITIFLAKLYAEQLINSKLVGLTMEPDSSSSPPNNIPELILNYLEKLNKKVERQYNAEYPEVKEYAKVIAWKCLEQSYKSQPVMRQILVDALGKDKAEVYLDYFERHLHLIRSIGLNKDKIRFAIDPIAEYLAGLYLVEKYGHTNQVNWRHFLDKAKSKPRKEIIGFLSALRECCLLKKATVDVPDFVLDELSALLEPVSVVTKQVQRAKINVQKVRLG